MVGAEPLEGRVEVGEQARPRRVDAGARPAGADAALGAQHDVVARDLPVQQGADDALRVAVAVRRGRVDERAARVDEVPQLFRRVQVVGVPPPGHGPQAELGHAQARSAHLTTLHGGPRYRETPLVRVV